MPIVKRETESAVGINDIVSRGGAVDSDSICDKLFCKKKTRFKDASEHLEKKI